MAMSHEGAAFRMCKSEEGLWIETGGRVTIRRSVGMYGEAGAFAFQSMRL